MHDTICHASLHKHLIVDACIYIHQYGYGYTFVYVYVCTFTASHRSVTLGSPSVCLTYACRFTSLTYARARDIDEEMPTQESLTPCET